MGEPLPQVTVTGKVQKGPFTNLNVAVYPINQLGEFGEPFQAQTQGSQYTFTVNAGQVVNVRASGTFIDEISGAERVLNTTQALESIFVANSQPQNINLLTTLAASRWKGASHESAVLSAQIESSQREIAEVLGFDSTQKFGVLDITTIESISDPSFTLLTLSGAMLDRDPQGTTMPPEFANMLDAIEANLPLDDVLTIFDGIDVSKIYETIQQRGVITKLPNFKIIGGRYYICQPRCRIVLDPIPSVSANNAVIYEGQGLARLRLFRTGDTTRELAVNIEYINGSAVLDKDYAAGPNTVVFLPGNSTTTFMIEPVIDNLDEVSEQLFVNLRLPSNSGYSLRRPSATVNILDVAGRGASIPNELSVTTAGCFVNLGLPTELLINAGAVVCAQNAQSGLTFTKSSDTSVQFLSAVAATCANGSCGTSTYWPFSVVLEALNDGNNTVVATQPLGNLLYARADLLASVIETPSVSRFTNVGNEQVKAFIAEAFANSHRLRIRLLPTINSTANITAEAMSLPTIAPSGDITFGESVFSIVSGSSLSRASDCPGDDDYKITGVYQHAFTGTIDAIVNNYPGEVCASYSEDEQGEGTWTVSKSNIDISQAIISLPDDHYFFLEFVRPGVTAQRTVAASTQSLLTGFTVPSVSIQLYSYISSNNMPFALSIASTALTERGYELSYDRSVLIDTMVFDADDPRAQTSASNSNLYRSINPGKVILTNNGLSGEITFNASAGNTAWPKGDLTWQAYTVQLIDGKLEDHSVSVDFSMLQSQDCSAVGCSQGNTQVHAVSGTLNIDNQGTAVGGVQFTRASTLSWGALGTVNAWDIENALEQNTQATLVLPGFLQRYIPGTAQNAVDGLVAHRRQNSLVHSTLGPNSDEFRLGNFFAPGINVGPELYVNGSGQPEVLNGTSLNNLVLTLTEPKGNVLPLSASTATKFVIQNAGLTGVFNANYDTMPLSFNLSNYDITLDRFALRTQNNTNDSYNWIDGNIRLEGDVQIGLAFTNLELSCDGSLGNVVMTPNSCGENCYLASWAADIDIFGFGFTSADNQPLLCKSAPAKLKLDHNIDFKALNTPLVARTIWEPQGTLNESIIAAQSQNRFDSRKNTLGYPILLNSASLRAPFNNVNATTGRYGTLEMTANIGLPFWLPISADMRLANTFNLGQSIAEPSVVLPRGSFNNMAYQGIEATLNKDLQALILNNDQFDINASYEWGSTGFGFSLPVFYDVALAHQEVSFSGRRQEIDVFVLDAGAGIDYIKPNKTKLSFGASADFAALKKARFQVDLSDKDGLAKVDTLLINANIIRQPVITPTFETIADAVSVVNKFAGSGIDPLMETLLLEAVVSVGEAAIPAMPNKKDPFDSLADAMAEIKNFPNHLIVQTDDIIYRPLNTFLSEQETFLRSELMALVNEIESLNANDPVSDALQTKIERVQSYFAQAEYSIGYVTQPMNLALDDMLVQVKSIDDAVNDAGAAVNEIEGVFTEVTSIVAAQCAIQGSVIGSESAGYLQAAFEQLANLKNLVQLLSGSEVLATLSDLLVDDPKTKESIRETQDTLRETATALLVKVAASEVALRQQLCQSDVSSLLTEVDLLLLQVGQNVAAMQALVAVVQNDIGIVKNVLNLVDNNLRMPLEKFIGVLNNIETTIITKLQTLNGEAVVLELDMILRIATGGSINALVARDVGQIDIFTSAFANATSTIKNSRDFFINNLQTAAKGLFPFGDMSADQLRRQLVTLVMDSDPVRAIRSELNNTVVEIIRQANSQVLIIADQANAVVSSALAKVENEVNAVLTAATAQVRNIPLESAELDGFGVISGNELERAHIGAQWTMSSSDESEPGNTFGAALDAVSWAANGKAQGCAGPGAESNLDVTISAMGIPASIGDSKITIKKVYLGFTLAGAANNSGFTPIGVNGGISTSGEISFTEFIIYDPAFAAGLGTQEVYLGASAGAIFSDIQAEVAFLLGKTCNQDVLLELDPNVAKYIPLPPTGFTGAYVRGGASIPVYSNGCPLTIGVAADMGAWVLKGPPLTLGGLVGGGAFGRVACVGALRGQIRAIGQVNTNGDITFIGEGFGVAGLGFCEPSSWTSVGRSRQDGMCGTADAQFSAGYQNGWSIFNMSLGAIY